MGARVTLVPATSMPLAGRRPGSPSAAALRHGLALVPRPYPPLGGPVCRATMDGPAAGATTPSAAAAAITGERLILDEYKVWKKNTPFLYDLVITKALDWPSLTVQWLPGRPGGSGGDDDHPQGAPYVMRHLLIGTHTAADDPNYLKVSSVRLPSVVAEAANAAYAAERLGANGAGPSGESGLPEGGGSDAKSAAAAAAAASAARSGTKFEDVQKIPHDGEVNRARYMPQAPALVATKSITADVLLFDTSKYPAKPPPGAPCAPTLRLRGHKKEGYGLSWSPRTVGRLASAADDGLVVIWDVGAPGGGIFTASGGSSASGGGGPTVEPTAVYRQHDGVVEDVSWNHLEGHLLASVGDDRRLLMWDTRASGRKSAATCVTRAHRREVNGVAFNPYSSHVLATASADRSVAVWDLRNMSTKVHSCEAHGDEVLSLAWSPFHEAVLASASADRRVHVWNLARVGKEQPVEDAADGPPELMFVHGGHTSKVNDLGWSPTDEWLMASVAEDNILQTWMLAEEIADTALEAVPDTGRGTPATLDGDGDVRMDAAGGKEPARKDAGRRGHPNNAAAE
nr:PhM00029.1 [Neoporphyra haitanensis]